MPNTKSANERAAPVSSSQDMCESSNKRQIDNPVVHERLPAHLTGQLEAVEGDPAWEHLHTYPDTPYLLTRRLKTPIQWILEETGEELSVKKYRSPVPWFQHQSSGKLTQKPCCLVATGPSIPEPALLETIEVGGFYRCRLWDTARYQAHGSDETMKVVKRIGRAGKGKRAVKNATGKRRRSDRSDASASEEDEPDSEHKTEQKGMQKRVQRASFGTSETTISSPRNLRRRSPVDYAGQQQHSESDTEVDELLQGFQTPQPLKPPKADSSAESIPKAAVEEAAPTATISKAYVGQVEPAVVDLIPDSSEDEQDSKSALLNELRCSNTRVRFFKEHQQLSDPIALSEMLTLDKFMAKAATKYVVPRDKLVLQLCFNDHEPVGIMKGDQGEYIAFIKTVLEDACWKVKSEGSGGQVVVYYVDVALL